MNHQTGDGPMWVLTTPAQALPLLPLSAEPSEHKGRCL